MNPEDGERRKRICLSLSRQMLDYPKGSEPVGSVKKAQAFVSHLAETLPRSSITKLFFNEGDSFSEVFCAGSAKRFDCSEPFFPGAGGRGKKSLISILYFRE